MLRRCYPDLQQVSLKTGFQGRKPAESLIIGSIFHPTWQPVKLTRPTVLKMPFLLWPLEGCSLCSRSQAHERSPTASGPHGWGWWGRDSPAEWGCPSERGSLPIPSLGNRFPGLVLA